jgi:hypothetical protein
MMVNGKNGLKVAFIERKDATTGENFTRKGGING